MIAKLCDWLCKRYPDRVRIISRDGEPYLLRFYITTPRSADDSDDEKPENFGLYLHYFYQGDKDVDLHNHPWKWALSLILSGTYSEERCRDGKSLFDKQVYQYLRRPGDFNLITKKDFHRISLIPGYDDRPIWTLFITGKRTTRWGFLVKKTGKYMDWKDYLREIEVKDTDIEILNWQDDGGS